MNLLSVIQHYGYVIVFIGTFLEGETVLLAAAYAAHGGYLNPYWVGLLAVTGSVTGDQVFFWIGRIWGSRVLARWPTLAPRVTRMNALLNRYHLPVIAVMRFLYGCRIAGPIAIGMSRLAAFRFLWLNFISAILWTLAIIGIGYGLHLGAGRLSADIRQRDELLLVAIVGLGSVFWMLIKLLPERQRSAAKSPGQGSLAQRFHQLVLAECSNPLCRFIWSLVSFLMIVAIVGLHYVFGGHPAFAILLLLPTLAATLRVGLPMGLAAAFSGSGMMLGADFLSTSELSPAMLVFNASLRLGIIALVAWGGWKIIHLSRILHELSLTDSLTALGNYRAFMARGEEEIQRARRGTLPLSVLFIDLDNFKAINDTSGHHAGDALLKDVATVLAGRLRHSDFAARLGGDEFGVILYAADGEGAKTAARQIQGDLSKRFQRSGHSVSASIGAVTFREMPEHFDEVLKRADALMYEVKRTSKDAVLHQEISAENMPIAVETMQKVLVGEEGISG